MCLTTRDIMYEGIEELDLGVRAYNFCRRNGVDTIAQLLALTVEDINTWVTSQGATLGRNAFEQILEAQSEAFFWIWKTCQS